MQVSGSGGSELSASGGSSSKPGGAPFAPLPSKPLLNLDSQSSSAVSKPVTKPDPLSPSAVSKPVLKPDPLSSSAVSKPVLKPDPLSSSAVSRHSYSGSSLNMVDRIRRPPSPMESLIGNPRRYGDGSTRSTSNLTSSDLLRGPKPYQ
ncbi:microtubule-associated protein RP/EB family member 1-like [Thunnus albacares]|uniref:microtubule-associated protein RP/EB family member 1-like n=1 Tax=Thunnus albacares TaxID=8236 RepID=UPI001CF6B5D6|nr:microtubule-associated protein RP/EB family member 1-like [Thunnus albacares]